MYLYLLNIIVMLYSRNNVEEFHLLKLYISTPCYSICMKPSLRLPTTCLIHIYRPLAPRSASSASNEPPAVRTCFREASRSQSRRARVSFQLLSTSSVWISSPLLKPQQHTDLNHYRIQEKCPKHTTKSLSCVAHDKNRTAQ